MYTTNRRKPCTLLPETRKGYPNRRRNWDPCPDCGQDVNIIDFGVECQCGQWSHIQCGPGLSNAQYARAAFEKTCEVFYTCRKCNPSSKPARVKETVPPTTVRRSRSQGHKR